jgi:hypothetical protein
VRARRIEVDPDGSFVVCSGYDKALVEAMRELPRRRWYPERHAWVVPASGLSATELLRIGRAHGFGVSPAARLSLSRLGELSELSGAIASDLTVPRLIEGLRPAQPVAVGYALRARRVIIADDRGTGKTAEALATLEAEGCYPALLVTTSAASIQLSREVSRWLPWRHMALVTADEGQEVASGEGTETAEILVTSYALLDRLDGVWRRPAALVCDEAHHLLHEESQRSRRVRMLARGASMVLLLSGTPMANRPADMLSLLAILGLLGEFGGPRTFIRRYCAPRKTRSGYLDIRGAAHLEELNQKLRALCYVRRLKKDIATEIPRKQRRVVPMPLNGRQTYERAAAEVTRWLDEAMETVAGSAGSAARADWTDGAREVGRRRRAEALVYQDRLKVVTLRAKLPACLEWLSDFMEGAEAEGRKVLVFADAVEAQQAVLGAFPDAARVTGRMRVRARQAQVDRFQGDPDCRLAVCALRAAGESLELQAATDVVFLDLPWVPLLLDQAEDRADRLGREGALTVWYLLAAGTVEEENAAFLDGKQNVVGRATEGRRVPGMGLLGALLDAQRLAG